MARQFITHVPAQPGVWSKPISLDDALAQVAKRTVVGQGPFTRRRNHETIGMGLWRAFVLPAFSYNVRTGKVGDVFSLRRKDGSEVIRVREVQPSVEVINTNGNRKADACWTAVVHQFTEIPIYFLGAYVCKFIVGSSTRSQHSYGNAVDFGSDSMDELKMIANWLVTEATALSIEHVIVADTAWTRGAGWGHYDGEYHYHVHADFAPQMSGPCGVKN